MSDGKKDNYLKNELYELIKTDERIFDFIQESSLDGLWYWDLQNPEEEWMNPKFWTVLGYDPEEMPHKSSAWKNIINQDDLKIATENLTKHLENPDHHYDQLVRYTHKNGSAVWIRCRGMAIRDNQGKPVRMLGAHNDITGPKQAEEALRLNEKYSTFLTETAFELVELNSIQEIYSYTVQKLYELFEGHSIVALVEFNQQENRWKIQHIAGIGEKAADLSKLLGFDIRSLEGDISTKYYEQITSGSVQEIKFDFPGLFNKKLSAAIGSAVKKLFAVEKMYSLAYEQDQQIIGNITFTTHKKSEPVNTKLIEAFIKQVSTIIKKQQAEELLKESLNFYKVTFEEAAVGIAHVLPNGNFFKVNKMFSDIIGYDMSELYQLNIKDISSPEDTKKENEYIRQILSKEINTYIIEKRYLHKKGHWVWVKLHSSVVRNPQDEIEFAVASISDITERKQAEEALRESEVKFKGVFQHANAGIAIANLEGVLTDVNKEFEELSGYSKAELKNMTVREFTHPDDMNIENDLIEKLFKNESDTYRIEKRYIHKNGGVIWVDVSIASMKNDTGEISHFIGMVKDITNNVRATQALKESEAKYRELLQHLHAGVVVHAADTSIRFANKHASQLLGLTNDQLMGKTAIDPDWHFVQEELTPASLDQYPVQDVIANKAPLREKVLGIQRPKTNDLVWVLVNAFPEFDIEGAIQQVVVTFIDITKRKQAEEALLLANDIVRNIQIGMYVYHLENVDDNRTLRLISANQATEDITGVRVSDIIGKTLDENFPYLRDIDLPQRMAEVVRNGEACVFEDIVYGDDRIMQAYFSVKAFPLPHNHLGVAFENVTEKVQAQNKIAESNTRLKMAQEIGNVGSWELDLLTNNVTWSENTYAIYEEDPDSFEVNVENIVNHYPEEEKERVLEALNKSITEKRNLLVEHTIVTGKGNTCFVMDAGRLILSEDGEPIKFIGSVADITQLKKTENELRKSRNLFQQISLISKTGGWNVDLVTGELKWTELTREIHEVGSDFVPDMEMAINFYEEEESREKIIKILDRCIETGEPFDAEMQLITAKGNKRWVRAMGSAEFQGGKCVMLNGTIQDITERKNAEKELIIAKEKAEESDKLKMAFLNNISHEIRTPLNGILGFGSFLAEEDASQEVRQQMLVHVEKSSKRLMDTVSDYVDMARIASGTMEMRKKEFLLHPFFEEVTLDARLLWVGKPIEFIADYQPHDTGVIIESDPDLIRRILNVLLDNAVKFTASGIICCGVKLKEGLVEFFVNDTGKGIAPEKLDSIFNIFTQEDPSNTRSYEGSGLGLSIANGLAKLMGGTLTAASEQGKGSQFAFTVPFLVL
jgi:PAS domain S-box-containing protein